MQDKQELDMVLVVVAVLEPQMEDIKTEVVMAVLAVLAHLELFTFCVIFND
jgi:hypothetical protein